MNTSPIGTKYLVAVMGLIFSQFAVSEADAKYGAFAYSTGSGSFGAFGMTWNYRTSSAAWSAAVATAKSRNGGYLNGVRGGWWSHRGWAAGARGWTSNKRGVKFAWNYGWKTASAAVNSAVNRVYNAGYRHQIQYLYRYNN